MHACMAVTLRSHVARSFASVYEQVCECMLAWRLHVARSFASVYERVPSRRLSAARLPSYRHATVAIPTATRPSRDCRATAARNGRATAA